MAFPSATGTRAETLSSAWEGARSIASKIKSQCVALKASSLAGDIGAYTVLNFLRNMADSRARLAILAAVPGLAAYAQAQLNDNTLNVATEFAGMVNAVDGLRTWIITNFPKDGNGYLLRDQLDAEGRMVERMFSTVAMAGLRTQLDAVTASID